MTDEADVSVVLANLYLEQILLYIIKSTDFIFSKQLLQSQPSHEKLVEDIVQGAECSLFLIVV